MMAAYSDAVILLVAGLSLAVLSTCLLQTSGQTLARAGGVLACGLRLAAQLALAVSCWLVGRARCSGNTGLVGCEEELA
jgi:hypothetical protein